MGLDRNLFLCVGDTLLLEHFVFAMSVPALLASGTRATSLVHGVAQGARGDAISLAPWVHLCVEECIFTPSFAAQRVN